MMNDNTDYKWVIFQLISALKAKPTYLKSIDANSSTYDKDFFEGMATAYHLMMDEVKNTLYQFNFKTPDINHFYFPFSSLNFPSISTAMQRKFVLKKKTII